MDEPLCFAECCQAEQLSWPSAAGPELWAVVLGEVTRRNLPPAVFVPCPVIMAADGSVTALWWGSGLASAGWCSAAALGPGKIPRIPPDALALVTTNVAHSTSSTWVASLGVGTASTGGGDGLWRGKRRIRETGKYVFCLFVAVVCSIQQVKFCSVKGLVGGKGTCSMIM